MPTADSLDIVLYASAPWQSVGLLNCHHVARRLAARHRVLYVEPSGLRTPSLAHAGDLRKVWRRLGNWRRQRGQRATQPVKQLWTLSPMALPLHGSPWARAWNVWQERRACQRMLRRLGMTHPLLWLFLPTGGHLAEGLHASQVIYHCVDDYASNPGVRPELVAQQERELVERATLCFATSRPLAQRLSAMGGQVHCMPNVGETERFDVPALPVPADLAALPGPRIGYVGNIAGYKLDLPLLEAVARARPAWSLVLVGPVGAGDPSTSVRALKRLPNVHLLGPRPASEIPAYVQAMNACLIPFRRSRLTDESLPLKTFEYLAAGRPVVSTPIASLTSEPVDDVIRYAASAEAMVGAIEEAIADDGPAAIAARKAVARRYSWTNRFAEIEAAVEAMMGGAIEPAPDPMPLAGVSPTRA